MDSRPRELNSDWSSLHDLKHCAAHLEAARLSLGSHVPTSVAEVDDLITRLWDLLGFLQSYRNTLVPISKLPRELLSQIMIDYAMDSGTLYDLKWTKIMRVCHDWHDVALKTQKLWSYISLKHMFSVRGDPWGRIEAQLKNAPTAPLSVKILLDDDTGPGIYEVVDQALNPDRLRALEITGKSRHMLSWFETMAAVSYPLLEELQVDSPFDPDGLAEGELVHLPDCFLDGRTPRLRSLKVAKIALRWDLLRGLRVLSVSDRHNGTFSEVVSALGRSPTLLSVEIPVPRRLHQEQYQTASLLNLRNLHLLGDVEDCSTLLSAIVMPGTASIAIYPQGLHNGGDARNILTHIQKHFRSEVTRPIQLLKIESLKESNFLVSAFDDTTIQTRPDPLDKDALFLLNSHPWNENGRRQILTNVLKALPVGSLTHFDMRSADVFQHKTWKATLSLLPSLRFVVVGAHMPSALTFIDTLLDWLQRNGTSFPAIQHLRLDASLIRRWWKPEERPQKIQEGKEILARAVELLTQLKEIGRPLAVFELTEAWDIMESSTLKRLYKLVGEKVLYDGQEYDPEWRRTMYNQRLESVRRLRERGIELPDPEPPSDSP